VLTTSIDSAGTPPELAAELAEERSLLALATEPDADPERVAEALDAERRQLIQADRERLASYAEASGDWQCAWPAVQRETAGLRLREAHAIVCEAALRCLPARPLP
jgi:hypothetical protein